MKKSIRQKGPWFIYKNQWLRGKRNPVWIVEKTKFKLLKKRNGDQKDSYIPINHLIGNTTYFVLKF